MKILLILLIFFFVNYAQTINCYNGYTQVGNRCWKIIDTPKNHDSARQNCYNDGGGHLAEPETRELDDNMYYFLQKSGHKEIYIGLTCTGTSVSSCYWDDGNRDVSTYNHFAPGNPTGGHICVAFETQTGYWTSHDCANKLSSICELPYIDPTTPTTTTIKPTPVPTPAGINVDRECGGDVANLWLDVVVVVDNSKGMTNEGITQVAAGIVAIFGNGTKIGTQYTDPRSTRIGIVTYNGQANVVADLNLIQSADDLYRTVFWALSSVSNSYDSYLATGLQAAENVLQSGRANGFRSNYKSLVIVYASEYEGEGELDPIPVSDRLKSSGVIISTAAFGQEGDDYLIAGLINIASPNYAFTSTDLNLVGELQKAALETNCFCSDSWTQYKSNYNDENSYKYGVCIRPVTIPSSWTAAKFACQNLAKNLFLVTEYNAQKHKFLFRVAQNTFSTPYAYHIGLGYVNGGWNWQQPAGYPLETNTGYAPWNPSYPKSVSSNIGVIENQFSFDLTVGWQNINAYNEAQHYMCEVAACDTDNYCA